MLSLVAWLLYGSCEGSGAMQAHRGHKDVPPHACVGHLKASVFSHEEACYRLWVHQQTQPAWASTPCCLTAPPSGSRCAQSLQE